MPSEKPFPWRFPHERTFLLLIVIAALVASAINPADRFTWWLEVSWILVGVPLVIVTHARFPLTALLERLLTFFALILIIGGYYTYEHVPFGEWFRAYTNGRNSYDRFGHFFQGVIPAMIARELLRRTSPLRPGAWLGVICVWGAVAFSACFELIEMAAARTFGDGAAAYLGSQGDIWDAQKDILAALLGSTSVILLFSRRHERELLALGVVR